MRSRFFIYIRFRGTSYAGWQVQPGVLTVQQIVEEALNTILREKIKTTGAGRTDSGVHARFFCAHFDSENKHLDSDKNFINRINKFLPEDIAVTQVRRVKNEAHARYSALSRTYLYYILKCKDPFMIDRAWYIPYDLNIETMNMASNILLKYNDFTSFSKLHSGAKTNICKIYYAGWNSDDNILIFKIKADRFLRNMVRAIVGTMVDVGRGKIDLSEFEKIILAKNRCAAGISVPAKGLFLSDIEYPDDIFLI